MTKKQWLIIIFTVAAFVVFDLGIYLCFTSRYIDRSPELMKSSSIELDKYLPFEENSLAVKTETDLTLSGELPVLDGATALFPIYSAFMNAYYPEGSCEFTGDGFTEESLLQKTGTTGAYKAICDGTADIIFVAQPSEKQLEYAESQGAKLEFVPIGYEAFVFIVNSDNPVDGLTAQQIKDIYSGKIKNWKELGGENTPIIPLQRAENSGSQTAMVSFMGDTPLMEPPAVLFGRSIGYSFRFYVSDISGKQDIKMLSVNGVYPDKESIRNGSYPITDCFYAVYRKDCTNENVTLLIDRILSPEGQDIIERTGYVGITN
ncbi:MAG: PstS family phosphate ABC transporter substrate-binding protein [Oscillospiraceae bacterium]